MKENNEIEYGFFLEPNTNENTVFHKVAELLFKTCKTRCKYYNEIEYGTDEEKSLELVETMCGNCPLVQIM